MSDREDVFARIWVCPVCQVHRRADLPREHGGRDGRHCPGGRRLSAEESTDA